MMKKIVSIAGVIAICISVLVFTGCGGQDRGGKWEYKIVKNKGENSRFIKGLLETLNKAGEEGWEVVTSYEYTNRYIILKRPK